MSHSFLLFRKPPPTRHRPGPFRHALQRQRAGSHEEGLRVGRRRRCLVSLMLVVAVAAVLVWRVRVTLLYTLEHESIPTRDNDHRPPVPSRNQPRLPVPTPPFRGGNIRLNHTTYLTERPPVPIVIAYAVSLIKCGDFQSTARGLTDAALVLRHSIHQTSARNSPNTSHYDYRMYAIVETAARSCSGPLQDDAGFTVLFRDSPVPVDDRIQDPFLRANIGREWCCGALEFVKLHAFTLPEPVVVHVDMDFVMHRPLDTLLDVLLYDKASEIGQRARRRLEVERREPVLSDGGKSADVSSSIPDQPQAAFTKDWGQVVPGYPALFQAGFLVARTNPQVLTDVAHLIRTERYVPQSEGVGFKHLGWGGSGIATYVGAMAMQGIMAYYYEKKAPGTWIELNQCRYNHMGMDAKMRGEPNFVKKHWGKCRNNATYCEDCMVTPLHDIYNIHYTQCRKPWLCVGEGNEGIPRRVRDRTRRDKLLLPVKSVHVDHCLQLAQVWHAHRTDLEGKLQKLTGDDARISSGQTGGYMPEIFQGHCTELGPQGYLPLSASVEATKRIPVLYGVDVSSHA